MGCDVESSDGKKSWRTFRNMIRDFDLGCFNNESLISICETVIKEEGMENCLATGNTSCVSILSYN